MSRDQAPQPVARLDLLFSSARLAHEVIFDIHGELAAFGAADAASGGLLRESARIALAELPAALAEARRLAAHWEEQSLLDPDKGRRTLQGLEAELHRVEPELRALRERQREIARALRFRLAER